MEEEGRAISAFDHVPEIRPQQVWDRVVARSVHGDRITLAVVELEPDSVVPEHSHENEQLGLLLDGSLVFRVGDERRELGRGGTWRIPPNVPHEVEVGPEGAAVIEVFSPRRDDWDAIETAEPRAGRWP